MQRGFLIFLPFRLPSFLIFQQKLRNISFVAQFAGGRRRGAVPSGHGIHKDSRGKGRSPPAPQHKTRDNSSEKRRRGLRLATARRNTGSKFP